MLSKKAKYGIRALLHLAQRHGQGPVLIRDISDEQRIPRKFLEAILVELKTAGILRSRPGKGGGYELLRPLAEISLGQIIRQIDGPLALIPCVSQTAYVRCDDCLDEQTCVIRNTLKQVRDETAKILDSTSLESLLEQQNSLQARHGGADFMI